MLEVVTGVPGSQILGSITGFLSEFKDYFLIFAGFSVVIFFHELGHFLAAKACNVRVDKFAIGFGKELFGFTRGETRYSFNVLPLGGYVKMLGQEDFAVDKSGELMVRNDPRAFTHKPVGQRMIIVSAGVVMNLLFAALVFMLVFMIGVDFPPAVVGLMEMESPAERAGLRVGDRMLEINGQEIADFNDVPPAILLSDPSETLKILVERTDPSTGQSSRHTIEVRPERYRDPNKRQIGVAPPMNNVVAMAIADPALPPDQQLQTGDKIVAVNGQKVDGLIQINEAIVHERGRWTTLTVERPAKEEGGQPRELSIKRKANLLFRPSGDAYKESGHLLGLVPRRQINIVNPGGPADRAGFKPGDVIVRWGNQAAPTLEEVLKSIAENADRDIRVTVRRRNPGGEDQQLNFEVRPRVPGWFRSSERPKVGMDPYGQEDDRLIVADIVPRLDKDMPTPAAALKDVMPRGSLLTKINGEPVTNWNEVVSRFIELAGSNVKLTWSYEGQPEQTGEIYIPHTLGTTFKLPAEDRITRIAGQSHTLLDLDGNPTQLSASDWRGAREMLRPLVGQTIEVEHRGYLDAEPKVEKVTVTKEMLDTWVQRIQYQVVDSLVTDVVKSEVQVLNPITAMGIGVRKTYYFIEQVYMMMKRMVFTRSVSMDNVSGPVGIVSMGKEIASHDLVMLMYFLALISANLAVINFLPLPIVDGGLFMFLIIEKIKGRPISLRVQVATQIIGLVLIIGIFFYVTFKDFEKIFG